MLNGFGDAEGPRAEIAALGVEVEYHGAHEQGGADRGHDEVRSHQLRPRRGEKQPSLQFTTVDQLGGLAVFLCSPAADRVRGVAWQVDGGWTAQ